MWRVLSLISVMNCSTWTNNAQIIMWNYGDIRSIFRTQTARRALSHFRIVGPILFFSSMTYPILQLKRYKHSSSSVTFWSARKTRTCQQVPVPPKSVSFCLLKLIAPNKDPLSFVSYSTTSKCWIKSSREISSALLWKIFVLARPNYFLCWKVYSSVTPLC